MEAIFLGLPVFLMYLCAKNYVKDNLILMKISDKVKYDQNCKSYIVYSFCDTLWFV